jgi:DNA sulfur modification protein DndC
MALEDSISLSLSSLQAYAATYRHWVLAYSGGKDSTTTATFVAWAIQTGQVIAPETLTVLYADTRMELLPLQYAAFQIMDVLRKHGAETRVVIPDLDNRFFVYMFGRGVPPPRPGFRWCTGKLKIVPMTNALKEIRERVGEKFLAITGVRVGESAARDQRIALACSRDGSECGQGWYHQTTPAEVADTLAPIIHWRVCHVWDWLMFHAPDNGFPTNGIAEVYGGDEAEEINARTGCVACNVASRETSLETVLKISQWNYLHPLKRLKPLYAELCKAHNRLRKNGEERYADGTMVKNPMRLGPLTMDARHMGIGAILAIQNDINQAASNEGRPTIDLINDQELNRIYELMNANTWPDKWSGDEAVGNALVDLVVGDGVVQPLLLK